MQNLQSRIFTLNYSMVNLLILNYLYFIFYFIYFFLIFASVNRCSAGYYKNEELCSRCDSTCATCTGPSNNQCTSCSYPLYISSN